MAKRKKSRKVGLIGVRKENWPERPPKRVKTPSASKTKGNESGTRQQLKQTNDAPQKNQKLDSKVGSKKPIDLNAYKPGAKKPVANTPKVVKYKTPQDELNAIENNQELEALLEKQLSKPLTGSELAFVEKMTARYQDLCDLLGIKVEDDEESDQISENDDPFASLDAIKLDDFKD